MTWMFLGKMTSSKYNVFAHKNAIIVPRQAGSKNCAKH